MSGLLKNLNWRTRMKFRWGERYIWAACVQSFDGYWSVDVLYRLLISNKKALNNSAVLQLFFVSCWVNYVIRAVTCLFWPWLNLILLLSLSWVHMSWSFILVYRNLLYILCLDIVHLLLFYQCSAWFMHWYMWWFATFIKFQMDPNKETPIALSSWI